LLVKLPVPELSDVCEPEITGFAVVPQHTPLAVTVAPPSFVIEPPVVAELIVISVTLAVVNVGMTGSFLQPVINTIPKIRKTKNKIVVILFIIAIIYIY